MDIDKADDPAYAEELFANPEMFSSDALGDFIGSLMASGMANRGKRDLEFEELNGKLDRILVLLESRAK